MARRVTWQVERAVARVARENQLWSPSATLVVGVSGGADSLCLLGSLHALLERGDPRAPGRLVVAHLDHGLRGAAGAADAAWVQAFASALGCAFARGVADVRTEAQKGGRSLEDAARVARYAFLRRLQQEHDAERICVGHTSDDQLETIVMSWLRGSGLAGLSGMTPLERDVARPLLHITRTQTEAYCAARGWSPREDVTNADMRFRRNRVRLELLPVLQDYNPNLRDTLLRNAALLAADEAYLEAVAVDSFRQLARIGNERVAYPLDDLQATPCAVRHRLFQHACAQLTDTVRPLEAAHILALDRLVDEGKTGDTVSLPGRLRAHRDYGTLHFERQSAESSLHEADGTTAMRWRLQIPGTVEMPELGWRLRAWPVALPPGHERDVESPAMIAPTSRRGTASELRRAELRVYVDAEKTGEALEVRLWQPGDRFQPLGTPFEKKVQDFFVDAKVPRAARRLIPLVFGRDHLIWVGGQRIDDRVKLTSATRQVLALQLEPLALAE